MHPVSLDIEEEERSVCIGCVLDLLEHANYGDSSIIAIFLLWAGEIIFFSVKELSEPFLVLLLNLPLKCFATFSIPLYLPGPVLPVKPGGWVK